MKYGRNFLQNPLMAHCAGKDTLMKRLLLVEGLPGTGKTTTAHRLSAHFAAKGEAVRTLLEGDARIPTNFYETAGVPAAAFDALLARHPDIPEEHWAIAARTAHYVFVRLDACAGFLADALRPWDMGDEFNRQITVAQYIPCALERVDHWVAASLSDASTTLIDSGFLQNPLNELLFRGASDGEASAFIQGIAQRLAPLHPLCFYLQRESAQAALSFARQAKGPAWADGVDALLRQTGFADFFERRFALERALLPCVPHVVCAVHASDWSDVDRQIRRLA